MTFNKIPLALGFNSSTGNASGLVEFTLGLSDVGDVCEATPTNGQVLTWSGATDGEWCPSTVATGGGGGGGGAVDSVNTLTGAVSLYFSSLSGTPAEANLPTLNGANAFTTATNSFGNTNTNITSNGNLSVGTTNITNSNGNLVVGGTLTIGDTVFTTDGNATLSNVDKNSLVITTGASAVSSLSGASGSIVYFEGTTPAPAFKTFAQILSNENYNISPGATYATTTSLAITTATADAALPEVGGVDKNSLVITTGASAVSSLSGASGTIPYFEGTTPAPVLKTFKGLLEDVVGSLSAGDLLYVDSGGNLVRLPSGNAGDVLTLQMVSGRQYPYWAGGE
jgi:hypothetical protein